MIKKIFKSELTIQDALLYLNRQDTVANKILFLSFLTENKIPYKARDHIGEIVYGYFLFGFSYEDDAVLRPIDVIINTDNEYGFLIAEEEELELLLSQDEGETQSGSVTFMETWVSLNNCVFETLILDKLNENFSVFKKTIDTIQLEHTRPLVDAIDTTQSENTIPLVDAIDTTQSGNSIPLVDSIDTTQLENTIPLVDSINKKEYVKEEQITSDWPKFDQDKSTISNESGEYRFSPYQYKCILFLYDQAKINSTKYFGTKEIFENISPKNEVKFDHQICRLFSGEIKKSFLVFVDHSKPNHGYRFKLNQ